METAKALENLFDKKVLNIVKLFISKKEQTFYLQEIAKQCRVPIATTYRIMNRLKETGIVKITRFKHWKVYSLDDNDLTKYLEKMFEETHSILDEFIGLASAIPAVDRIVELHGSDPKERKYKVSVIILGNVMPDTGRIKEVVGQIKEKYNFTIVQTTLTFEQFEQLAAHGLYSGKKLSVLFERQPVPQ